MELQEILKLMKEKYGDTLYAIMIYDDGTGRITSQPELAYDGGLVLSFKSVEDLVQKLQEK